MRPYTPVAMQLSVAEQVEALRARIAVTDPVRVLQRSREARMRAVCATCADGNMSAAAIAQHNLRSAEFGERHYPQWLAAGRGR